jgi:hypothetical protein
MGHGYYSLAGKIELEWLSGAGGSAARQIRYSAPSMT